MFNKLKQYDIIVTDCFDTLVFRDVMPAKLGRQWARLLAQRYPQIAKSSGEIEEQRERVYRELANSRTEGEPFREIVYEEWMEHLYRSIGIGEGQIPKQSFIGDCRKLEIALENGSTYRNKPFYDCLCRMKKAGKKIICLSDYYFGADVIKDIMLSCGIDPGLFDDVITSADVGLTKRHGDLYAHFLRRQNCDPKRAIMIGDSRTGDYQQARNNGMAAVLAPNYLHKLRIRRKRRPGYVQHRNVGRLLREGLPYSELAFLLYVCGKRLYAQCSGLVNFMSREGLMLKKAYEAYRSFRPDDKTQTNYIYISRRSIMAGLRDLNLAEAIDRDVSIGEWIDYIGMGREAAREVLGNDFDFDEVTDLSSSEAYRTLIHDQRFLSAFNDRIESNYKCLKRYIGQCMTDDTFLFVDIGWKGTSQKLLEERYGFHTEGYYLGIQKGAASPKDGGKAVPPPGIMHALLFDEYNPGIYDDFLDTNVSLYEQILAAPHGTVIGYEADADGVRPVCEWDPIEEEIYKEYIKEIQTEMLAALPGIIAWDEESDDLWFLSKLIMRGSMFARGKRLVAGQKLNKSFVVGVRGAGKGEVKYDYNKLHIGFDLFTHPERYVKYMTKVQRVEGLYNRKAVRIMYNLTAPVFYGYTCLITNLRKKAHHT